MKLYAPAYYKYFSCVAEKCRHSCCVGWEIDVDEESMIKYSSLVEGYGRRITESIEKDEGGCPHIRLDEGERCPHLDSRGLCRIITELGEDYLCEICREHPRFYNDTRVGKEVGIGMACSEAARIILESDEYESLEVIGELEGESVGELCVDATDVRAEIYGILKDTSMTYRERLCAIYDLRGISPTFASDEEWRELLDSLEYLDESHKRMLACYSSKPVECENKFENELRRVLAYFVFRHVSPARDEYEIDAAVGFCLFCERLLASLINVEQPKSADELIRLARIVSEEIEYSEDNTEQIKDFFFGLDDNYIYGEEN